MDKRVSSTVTKPTRRKANPRPRKYASASERQAAYRARAPEVCFRAEAKTVETLDRIAETLDQSRADVLLSMTKFALANHDWARFGLTHKPLPFEYGVNPIMATKKRKPTPAQLAARERFAEMARSGGFKKAGAKRKANPTDSDEVSKGIAYAQKRYQETGKHYLVTSEGHSALDVPDNRKAYEGMGLEIVYTTKAKGRKRNPAATSDLDVWMSEYRQLEDINAHSENVVRLAELVGTKADQSLAREILERQQRVGFLQPADYEKRSKLNAKLWPKLMRLMKVRKTNPTKKTVSQKISQLTREGYPQKQAVAIALNEERAGKVRRNPAPAKQRMGRIVRVDPKTGVPFGTELVPIDFTFKEWVGNYQHDFFARTEGAQLVVSEKTTGAKVGAVPFTLRSAALNDRAAAKAFVQNTVEKVGADRFNAAIAKAPKLTA